METRDIKFVLERLELLEDRVASLEGHVRNINAIECEKCGKVAAYRVREGKTSPGGYGAIGAKFAVTRCVQCGHEGAGQE